jgi:translation elongation factor EF-Tu-like GTPase
LQGPIWISDQETGQPITGIDIVDNDDILCKINYEISCLCSSYYEFDSPEQPCWFNEEQEKKDKNKMLSLLHKLIDRLNEINDGSFEIEDFETPRVEKL